MAKACASRHQLARAAPELVLCVLMAACSGGGEDGDPSGPEVWSVATEPLVSVGEQEGAPEYLFDDVRAVRLAGDGGLAVADGGSGSIRVYDEEGRLLASMGRPGEGPGEFARISHLEFHPPDTLLAYDGDLFRITRFLMDGTRVDERPIRAEVGSPELYLGTYADGGAALASLRPPPRGGTEILPDQMVVGRYAPDGAQVAQLGTLNGIRRAGGIVVVPFTPFLHAFVLGDSVFYTDGMEPVMHVLGSGGTPARSFDVPMEAPDLDASWSVLRRELEAREETIWIEDLPPDVEALPVPAIAEVVMDQDGRFWLKHYDAAADASALRRASVGGGRWTVVEPDGAVVASVDLPPGFEPMDARDMRVAGVQRDALGVERVVVLELELDDGA